MLLSHTIRLADSSAISSYNVTYTSM